LLMRSSISITPCAASKDSWRRRICGDPVDSFLLVWMEEIQAATTDVGAENFKWAVGTIPSELIQLWSHSAISMDAF